MLPILNGSEQRMWPVRGEDVNFSNLLAEQA
jgi:hypothetical protein